MRLAFWRRSEPPAPTTPPDKDRPDPDVQLRMAQAKVALVKMMAAESERITQAGNERLRENHISERLADWIHTPTPSRPQRRMPWSNAS